MSNMKEIAKLAEVSLGTVSHVMNGTANVRQPLRERVLKAIDQLGYQPSQLARGLRRDRTNLIGMIIPDITNPFFPAVVRGAEDVAFANGYRLVLCNTDNDHVKEIEHLNELRTFSPAGLIVIPSDFSDLTAQMESYRRSATAVVCVDRLPKGWDGDSLTCNNETGAYDAIAFALRQGHRKLAIITGPRHLSNVEDRLRGFLRAVGESSLKLGPEHIHETTFDQHGGYTKAKLLLRIIPRPTLIFATNDMIAFGVLAAIHDAGLRCPEDVSLIGFDDLEFAKLTSPSLSSVTQPSFQMGTTAATMLIDRIRNNSAPARHVILETALQIRGSVTSLISDSELPSSKKPTNIATNKKQKK